jgi:crotonobetainyl-CoA:carnitine CoA-transferase CaiB-like acyl-CoA transferase
MTTVTAMGVPGPLAGIRVVDFSAVVSGPFATMWLADQGADVVKIEMGPDGDITRGRAEPNHHRMAGLFVNCNRGKRGICVDVATPEGRAIVLELCAGADVFFQNWRPGIVEKLGLAYDDVKAVRPDIIYVSISGYGPDGPYAQRRVYDPIIQGLTGHVAIQVNPDIPIPDLHRTIVTDKATALTAAQATCAALFARERGAGGQHLQIPMLDVGAAFVFPDGYQRAGLLDDTWAPKSRTLAETYRLVATQDGHLTYYVANDKEIFGLFRALGHPEWSVDPRFDSATHRLANFEALGALIESGFAVMTTVDALEALEREQVAFGPVLSLDEVPNDVQIIHNQAMRVRKHPDLGRVREARQPVRFSGTPADVPGPLAPRLGEHTREVLYELGQSEEQIADLFDRGIAFTRPAQLGTPA